MSKDNSLSKTYLGGRLVTGPDNTYFFLTLFLTYAPHVPFFALICPYFDDKMTAVVYVIPAYFVLAATACLYLAAFTDPGIVPRGRPLPEDNPFTMEQKAPMTRKYVVGGTEVDTKWCDTCCVYRPLRTSHCGICNNCVENFDHHCPWVGNCIGKRNYRYFLLFVFLNSFECLYVMALSIAHIVMNTNESDKSNTGDKLKDGLHESYYFSIILPIYALAGLGFVGGLTGFHCFLVGSGISTNEFIKKTFKNRNNPFSHGFCKNYIYALCPPGRPGFFKHSLRRVVETDMDVFPPAGSSSANNANVDNNIINSSNNV